MTMREQGTASRRTVLVTGASAGLGAAVSMELAARSWDVLAASRRGEAPSPSVRAVVMNVTERKDVEQVIGANQLDVVVCNAGINHAAVAEELDEALARQILETNFWGVVQVIRTALPQFRARRRGRIVVIGSLAGLVAPPGEAYYAASKHALEGFLESLQYEVTPFGIGVCLVEPGFIKTDLASGAPIPGRITDYAGVREELQKHWQVSVMGGMSAQAAASAIADLVEKADSPFRVRLGGDAVWIPRLKRLLPQRLFFRLAARRYGIVA